MAEAKIPGGCFLVSRKLMDSGIMNKPPNYLKVWMILLSNAFHTDKDNLKRGQGFTSIPKLIDALTYNVGYRLEKPTKKQVWGIIDWLRNPYEGDTKEPMIVTTKVTHGFVYTIVNYDLYQDMSNYEGKNEGTTKVLRRERQGNNINKNDKELNKYTVVFEHWNSKKIIVHKNLNADIKKSIDKALKTYSEKEILDLIDRYHEVLVSDYFFSYKWSLKDFLSRKDGISSFTDEGSKWCDYLSRNIKTKSKLKLNVVQSLHKGGVYEA